MQKTGLNMSGNGIQSMQKTGIRMVGNGIQSEHTRIKAMWNGIQCMQKIELKMLENVSLLKMVLNGFRSMHRQG